MCKIALLFLTVGVVGCRGGSFGGDVRSAARESQCEANLRALYDALVQYVSLHGDLPRGKDGRVSIDRLGDSSVQRELGIDSSVLRCPADENSARPSYVLNPALSVDDLARNSATVIACDRAPNHHFRGHTHNSVRMVLIGDGSRVVMDLRLKDQGNWYRLFLAGDKRACTVSAKDGEEGNWRSAHIIWYVGQEKGCVPNG